MAVVPWPAPTGGMKVESALGESAAVRMDGLSSVAAASVGMWICSLPPEPGIWLTACGTTFCTSCAIGPWNFGADEGWPLNRYL